MSDSNKSSRENSVVARYDTVDDGQDSEYTREVEVRSRQQSSVSSVSEQLEHLQKSKEIESHPHILTIPIRPSIESTHTSVHFQDKVTSENDSIPLPPHPAQEANFRSSNEDMKFDLGSKVIQPVMEHRMNLEDRDEFKNAQFLNTNFFEVFAEPSEQYHSIACVWTLSFKIFEIVRIYFYKILTLIFGLIIAVIAGLGFALFAFINIWIIRPTLCLTRAALSQLLFVWPMFLMYIARPWFYAMGAIFSTIRLHSSKGEPLPEVWEKHVHTV